MPTIHRLAPGDEPVLELLAREDEDFDLDGRGDALVPLDPEHAKRFLADPDVLCWAARDGEAVLGFLYCLVVPLRSGNARELLLYEIGVRQAHRHQGIGRALLNEMEAWMRQHGLQSVWVLADNPGAVTFYKSCGFAQEADQPIYLTREGLL